MINAVMPLRHNLVNNCSRRSKTGQSTGTDGAQSLGEAMHEEHARLGAGRLAVRAQQVLDPCPTPPRFLWGGGREQEGRPWWRRGRGQICKVSRVLCQILEASWEHTLPLL